MLSPKLIFQRSKNFTSDAEIWIPPTVPINHYPGVQTNKIDHQGRILLFHANVFKWANACFKHSNFFTVNDASPPNHQLNGRKASSQKMTQTSIVRDSRRIGPDAQIRNPTTSFLTATTLIYAIGAGITAAAGTRLALQLILVKGFKLFSFQLSDLKSPTLLFIVTTSLCQDWVIYAPAAFLGCGSRF